MRGSGNKGPEEPYKSAVLNRMRTIAGRHYMQCGVLATRIAEGKEDFDAWPGYAMGSCAC